MACSSRVNLYIEKLRLLRVDHKSFLQEGRILSELARSLIKLCQTNEYRLDNSGKAPISPHAEEVKIQAYPHIAQVRDGSRAVELTSNPRVQAAVPQV